ncbi:hypothetical protein Tco_0903574 [Tanacetum coccineum]
MFCSKCCLENEWFDLPEELDGVHDTFHVSNLKKCLADPTLQVPLDEIQVDAKLNFMEEPMEILEKEFKKLKRSRSAIVKILYRVDGGDFMRIVIIPPRMRTRSAGRPVAESRGGGTGERVSRGGRGRGPRVEGVNRNVEGVNGGVGGAPNLSTIIAQQLQNLIPAILAQVGNQGNVGNQNDNAVNENVQENVRNVLVNGNRIRGMVVATEPKTIQKAVQISGALTNKAVMNGSIKKVEKRGNMGEPSKDKNGRDDNKRTRTGNSFTTTANPVGRENGGTWPKCTTCNSYHARGACHECGSTDHLKPACSRLNRAQGPGGNRPNHVAANNGGQGHRNQWNCRFPIKCFTS